MDKRPKKLILLDGNALIHRAYHALPPLTTPDGKPAGAVYGFAMTLLSVLEKFKPDYIAASFDLSGPTFRDEMYKEYKATRTKAPDDLYEQIPLVKEVVRAFNIPIYEMAGFEADDVIGTIARQASGDDAPSPQSRGLDSSPQAGEQENGEVSSPQAGEQKKEKEIIETIIVTGDNDALQLVSPLVKVFSIRKGLKDLVLYDRDAVIAKYGFPPERVADYKGLAGDSSDNIPGVAGIGAKTATDLIKEFGSLETIYESLPSVKESVRKKLEADRETAFLSKDLGTIRTDVPVTFDATKCVAAEYDRVAVAALFRELGFYSLLKRLPEAADSQQTTDNSKPLPSNKKQKTGRTKGLKTKDAVEKFLKSVTGDVAVWIEVGEETLFGGAGIVTVEVAFQDWIPGQARDDKEEATLDEEIATVASLPRNDRNKEEIATSRTPRNDKIESATIEWNEETKTVLKDFFENENAKKIFYDAKTAWHILKKEGIALFGISFDAMLAAYLLQSGIRVEFEHLVIAQFGEEAMNEKARALRGLSVILSEKMEAVSAEQQGKQNLEARLPSEGWDLWRLFCEVEMPLIPILAEMEDVGITLNTEKFRTLSDELGKELADIEKKIYDLAGREFNVNSPKQLAEILFVDLHIPTHGIKKTKTGISTASSELEKLKEYPIVSLIEENRELFKLKTTYLDAFPDLVDAQSRLHTTYQQAVASTGRLSSVDPNLQNIPAREKWSVAIRGAFEASPGNVLVGVDYSQVELRVMAHLSGDANLVSAFERGQDVHRATASAVYGVLPEDVTPDQRREAKVFNFGLMYGMGAYGLAGNLGIDQKKAAQFIEMYFTKFPGVAKYMESMKVFAKEKGYVETELGRRRYVPEIQGSNPALIRAGERMAINMPVQGLAADIMKLSMLRAAALVSRYDGKVALLLQVHDELIFEVEESVAEPFAVELKREMEAAYVLRVPLIVEAAIGKNWGEI